MALLEATDVRTHFPGRGAVGRREPVRAVDGVSLTIDRGETVGLVGESGCGKSTLGRTLLRLQQPTSGTIMFDDEDLTAASPARLRELRRRMQMIFQDPSSSLDPRMKVRQIIAEPMMIHRHVPRSERRARINDLLDLVGLTRQSAERYPHEFSGGQQQRIGIARALAVDPTFVVCDEAVSALDVSVQAQIVNLLSRLRKELSLTYLFISHDLGVVRHISDRVAVMYLGRIVEIGPRDELFAAPQHPYTHALLSAVPIPHPETERNRKRIILPGNVPSPARPPSGCRFRTRCPIAEPQCAELSPELIPKAGPDHLVACHLVPSNG